METKGKFRLSNIAMCVALGLALVGCDSDDNDTVVTTPSPSEEYVADQGFHISPTQGVFSGEDGEQPKFVVPTNAHTPIVTSDVATRTSSTRNVVQFTTADNAGLVAGFDLGNLAFSSLPDASTIEFDLRMVGAANIASSSGSIAQYSDTAAKWTFLVEGQDSSGADIITTMDFAAEPTAEWSHFVFTKSELLKSNAELTTITAIKMYPNTDATVYNVDNVAVYPEYRDSEGPQLTLIGGASITQLNYPDAVDTFEDPGYSVTDNQDDTTEIVVKKTYGDSGEVDADKNDTYQITYSAVDTTGNVGKPVTRTVIIEAAPDLENDITPPELTLNGASTVRVELDGEYVELGATANDDVDGEIKDITISGEVDVHTIGNYTITYTATDSSNNTGTAERTVTVYESVVSENLIVNGDFSTSIGSEWVLQEGEGKLEIVEGQLVISEFTPGATWQPRFVQSGVELEQGQAYIVTFDAKAGEARNIVLQVGQLLTTDPWYLPVMDDTTVGISTEVDNYSVQFTANENAAKPVDLIFAIGGGAATPITLDNISIEVITADMIAPVITLTGSDVRMSVGEIYVEPGYVVNDNVDGDITASVVVTGDDFSTAEVGTHTVTYTVEDSDGNESVAERTVYVLSTEDVDNLVTNGDFSSGLDGWLQFAGVDPVIVDGAVKYTTGVLKQERFGQGSVQPGDQLVVSLKMKGAFTEGGVFKVGLHTESPDGSGLPAESKWEEYWSVSSDWTEVEIPWTLGQHADSISIELLVAGPPGQEIYLDDIAIKPATF
ncbi:immunoglobulin-like domain-containing protein [Vibrio coralliirubri]|uniref:immunoglobulin-like domain-containing protein n=1 Tax=Vibrio coralliirubri TaxID=1516159 RepID=UPI0006383C2E|nr:immunoglobulin-like domain-containing protein [Vibrio coralliirubri]CDT12852.1 exported hypothetical protein [Vibrio coralliirubri]CDT15605.1 exported hypothetical protein [Vibrio coralliirubri]CDT74764.1 exported hypothetical protein [Vibrio coralliirubri]CDT97505.1 exported hypothetical protein [Vibrio coralliirubri]